MTTALSLEPREIQVVEVPVTGSPKRGMLTRFVSKLGNGGVQVGLALVALFWLTPVIGLLVASFRSEQANTASGWWTIFTKPLDLTLENYAELAGNKAIWQSFLNTVYIAVPSTVLVVVISALAAYALAWIDFPGRDWLTVVVVGLLVMPIQVALIPVAKLFGAVGLFGTIAGVVLFHVAFGLPFAVFLLRNFFTGIPVDLVEAARMDGATEWVVFRRVILPIAKPALASLTIFQFLWVWNDLLVALVFADQDSAPITVALRSQLRQFGANIDLLSTGAFLSMAVPLVVFLAFQKYFVQGVLAGSTK
ncbi:carbohydrate ABC transporter membrane protein 2, CUT1 family [Actinokineospora alba]|uniref:Carbohydrate ABC transporter membrane protein 2, CUT1 family n=1 Tax=Actinokineospora alba TaxID=504798 RepID=A0A1H0L444_9PSEU|nr:carbohydrate ABC transporter permease [Actinokineospora alba]TDP67197.1 alpha-glucoside transport system permease protein [Actinokineospora alba]SDJ04725.1 alpha-glucoside transport system permease protein [Actinokineospora alba]SDO62999.1 carbohydrate ABC transporter membrane protein 2, CUT1 family [Actinokineospora alba]